MASVRVKPKFVKVAPNKRVVILAEEEYEGLLDALDMAEAKRALSDKSDRVLDWDKAGPSLIRNRIAAVRKSLGVSQETLARRLKVRQSTVSRWEREDANLTLNVVRRIAKALGCPVHRLIS